MQKLTLIGYLGRDARKGTTPNGDTYINFTVATNETYLNKETGELKEVTIWHDCTAWYKKDTKINNYLTQGKQVYIEGTVHAEAYKDEVGTIKTALKVKVKLIELLGGNSKPTTQPTQPSEESETNVPF